MLKFNQDRHGEKYYVLVSKSSIGHYYRPPGGGMAQFFLGDPLGLPITITSTASAEAVLGCPAR
jgi:hypothetical protein